MSPRRYLFDRFSQIDIRLPGLNFSPATMLLICSERNFESFCGVATIFCINK
jgi:hypothetical protein